MEKNKLFWPVRVQCLVLGVSASGYRQHRARRKKTLTRRNLCETALLVEIRAVYATLAISAQHSSSSKPTLNNKPSQPDREGSTPTG